MTRIPRLLTALLSISLLWGTTVAQAEPQLLDRIVAIVNDEAISQTALDAEIASVKLQLKQQNAPIPPADILQKQVLERLIAIRLQLQLAQANNIVVDEDSLNRAIQSIAQQNRMSLSQFRQVLEADGYDFNKFREDIRTEIITTRLRQRQVESRITVSDAEVDQLLTEQKSSASANDEYRLGHILIAVPEAASSEEIQAAKAKARALVKELRQGADFATVAMSNSSGQQALSGGDLGWRKAGQLPTLFAKLVPQMKVGDVSQPIRSPSGYHIIKLLDHRGGERHVVTQTHARHILLRPNALKSDQELRDRLEELKQRAESGDDFGELAKAHSEDTASALNGGDLGWASPGVMVPQFEKVMQETPVGEISEPFQTQFGWHILQVLDRRDYDNTEEYKRNEARRQLRERKIAEEQELWLRRLRDEAYIEIRLGTDDTRS